MIKLLTLKLGMNIISDVEQQDSKVIIKKPAVVMSQQQSGQIAIGFSPFLEMSEEFETGITIDMTEVLTITTPKLELINQYNRYFGSGIQIATAESLLK
jgi:hypothetical protein